MWAFLIGWGIALAQDTGFPMDPSDSCDEACMSAGLCQERGGTCVAESDEDCRNGMACAFDGHCTAQDGACVVGSEADCAASDTCAMSGACGVRDGVCVVTSSADCRDSEACMDYGQCTLLDGHCRAGGAADCAQAANCASDGECDLVNATCLPTSNAHCADSDLCTAFGRCVHNDNACIGSPQSCASGPICTKMGRCSFKDGKCVAATADHCRKSAGCRDNGRCAPENGICTASREDDCAASSGCRERGNCGLWEPDEPDAADGAFMRMMRAGPSCGPRSDGDCAASTRCRSEGHCTIQDGFMGGPLCSGGGLMGLESGIGSLLGGGGMGTLWGDEPNMLGSTIGRGVGGSAEGLGGLGVRGGHPGYEVPKGEVGTIGGLEWDEDDTEGFGGARIEVQGGLTRRAVRPVLRGVRTAFAGCIPPDLADAGLRVRWLVRPNGKAKRVLVLEAVDTSVERCLQKASRTLRFPKDQAASVVEWQIGG